MLLIPERNKRGRYLASSRVCISDQFQVAISNLVECLSVSEFLIVESACDALASSARPEQIELCLAALCLLHDGKGRMSPDEVAAIIRDFVPA